MKHLSAVLAMTLSASTLSAVSALAAPTGDRATFTSPNGLSEICVAPTKLPGANYFAADLKREKDLCSLNFYDNSTALCAKTWSTSPGTIVNDNRQTGLTSEQAEAKYCTGKANPLKAWAKFKQSMNQMDTSATDSLASIMYYQLSRALNASVHVPVAVYRTMDLQEHYARVSQHAKPLGKMNANGWAHVQAAEKSPMTYNMASDFLTVDRKQIYGILIDGGGDRYGAEINGTRALNSIVGQNYELQNTPASLALRSPLPFEQAMASGIAQAFADPKMAAAFPLSGARPQAPSNVQMNSWMREMSEISLLDYILDQQDRVGNIDYKWKWVYLDAQGAQQTLDEKSDVPLTKKALIKVPAQIAAFHPVLVQKSILGDNDAGGSGRYSNEAKNSGALNGIPTVLSVPKHEPIHHLAAETYRRLILLGNDFAKHGPITKAIGLGLGLTKSPSDVKRMDVLRTNVLQAAQIFRSECSTGRLMFDLVSDEAALRGEFSPTLISDCANP